MKRSKKSIRNKVNKHEPYLSGEKFTLRMDHDPIEYLKKMGSTDAKLVDWAFSLFEYNFNIVNKAGKLDVNASMRNGINCDWSTVICMYNLCFVNILNEFCLYKFNFCKIQVFVCVNNWF